MSSEIAIQLERRIDELGLQIDLLSSLSTLVADSPLSVTGYVEYRTVHRRCKVLFLPDMTMESLANHLHTQRVDTDPLLILGSRITERSAALFRQLDINYLDQAGNASIRFDTVLIDVRGRRSTVKASSGKGSFEKRHGAVNLFSAKRAQVIFVLLQWPELVQSPVRVIAHAAQVSLGQVQDTLNLLQELGYLDSVNSRNRQLRRSSELLELWAHSYPSGLGSSVSLYKLEGNPPNFQAGLDRPIFISGEAAVPEYLRPMTLTLYVEKLSTKGLIVANRWRSGPLPNVFLRKKFWNDPQDDEPLFSGSVSYQSAPPILVYADLLGADDPRQKNVAKQFREDNAELQKL